MNEKMGYKRLETDDELRKRCCGQWCPRLLGPSLDEHVEAWHGPLGAPAQRRIVEVFP